MAKRKQYRSAEDGRIVTKEYAEANPATTYSQSIQEKDMPKRKTADDAAAKEPTVEETNEETTETLGEIEPVADPETENVETPATESNEAVAEEAAIVEEEPVEAPASTANDAEDVDMGGYDYSEVTDAVINGFLESFPTKDVFDAYIGSFPDGPKKERLAHVAAAIYAKIAAGDETTIVKSGGRKVAVRGFFGSFKNSVFIEDKAFEYGIAENVDDETFNALTSEFPNAEIIVS